MSSPQDTTRRQPVEPKKLVYFEDDVARLNKALTSFQETTHAKGNVILDVDGQVATQTGEIKMAPETLSALVSSSFAATRDVAAILPQDEFISLTHQGPLESVQLTHVHDRTLLATVFDSKTTVHVIAFYLKALRDELAAIVKEVAERKDRPVDLGAGFEDSAKDALDDMFGESQDPEAGGGEGGEGESLL